MVNTAIYGKWYGVPLILLSSVYHVLSTDDDNDARIDEDLVDSAEGRLYDTLARLCNIL